MRKLVWTVVVWTIIIALITFPLVYSVQHWSSTTFRDGAVGTWLGTALGIIVGLPVGLALDRLRERTIRKHRQRSLGHVVYRELESNQGLVTLLDEELAQLPRSQPAGPDFWKWAETVVGGFELETYGELGATLMPEERVYYARVANTYDSLRRLASTIRQSTVREVLLLRSGSQGEASNLVVTAKALSGLLLPQIKDALEELERPPEESASRLRLAGENA